MTESIEINQKAAIGSETTQIAIQNNYSGLTPSEACDLATKLFYDNFPRLQECAMQVTEQRIKEFMDEVAKKLQQNNVVDMTPLADPDVQYSLFEAQKSYARFGTAEMLSILSDLISNRVQCNNDDVHIKVSVDSAIEIAGLLSQNDLDYLSFIFLVKQVKFSSIKTFDELKTHILHFEKIFSGVSKLAVPYLDSLKCLKIQLGSPAEMYSDLYGFDKNEIENVLPALFDEVSGDHGTSPIGTVLAIVNAEKKTPHKFSLKTWID